MIVKKREYWNSFSSKNFIIIVAFESYIMKKTQSPPRFLSYIFVIVSFGFWVPFSIFVDPEKDISSLGIGLVAGFFFYTLMEGCYQFIVELFTETNKEPKNNFSNTLAFLFFPIISLCGFLGAIYGYMTSIEPRALEGAVLGFIIATPSSFIAVFLIGILIDLFQREAKEKKYTSLVIFLVFTSIVTTLIFYMFDYQREKITIALFGLLVFFLILLLIMGVYRGLKISFLSQKKKRGDFISGLLLSLASTISLVAGALGGIYGQTIDSSVGFFIGMIVFIFIAGIYLTILFLIGVFTLEIFRGKKQLILYNLFVSTGLTSVFIATTSGILYFLHTFSDIDLIYSDIDLIYKVTIISVIAGITSFIMANTINSIVELFLGTKQQERTLIVSLHKFLGSILLISGSITGTIYAYSFHEITGALVGLFISSLALICFNGIIQMSLSPINTVTNIVTKKLKTDKILGNFISLVLLVIWTSLVATILYLTTSFVYDEYEGEKITGGAIGYAIGVLISSFITYQVSRLIEKTQEFHKDFVAYLLHLAGVATILALIVLFGLFHLFMETAWPASGYLLAAVVVMILCKILPAYIKPRIEKSPWENTSNSTTLSITHFIRNLISSLLNELGNILAFLAIGAGVIVLIQIIFSIAKNFEWLTHIATWQKMERMEGFVHKLHVISVNIVYSYEFSILVIITLLVAIIIPSLSFLPKIGEFRILLSRIALVLLGIASFSFVSVESLDTRYKKLTAHFVNKLNDTKKSSVSSSRKILASAIISHKLDNLSNNERLEFGNMLRSIAKSSILSPKIDYLSKRMSVTYPKAEIEALIQQHNRTNINLKNIASSRPTSKELENLLEIEVRQAERLNNAKELAINILSDSMQKLFPDLPSSSLKQLTNSLVDKTSEVIVEQVVLTSLQTFKQAKTFIKNKGDKILVALKNWNWTGNALTGQPAHTLSTAEAALAAFVSKMIAQERQAEAAKVKARPKARFRWPKFRIR